MENNGRTLHDDKQTALPYHQPDTSTIPNAYDNTASSKDYDNYFRIVRGNPDLATWTHSYLSFLQSQSLDLEQSELSTDDQINMLKGMLIVQRITLLNWLEGFNCAKNKEEAHHE